MSVISHKNLSYGRETAQRSMSAELPQNYEKMQLKRHNERMTLKSLMVTRYFAI